MTVHSPEHIWTSIAFKQEWQNEYLTENFDE